MKPGPKRDPSRWMTKVCPTCGDEFETPDYRELKHCSRQCWLNSYGETKTTTDCPWCGTEFTYYKSWPRKYCSNKCKGHANIGNIDLWEPTAYTTECEWCGNEYATTPAATRGRFCSRKCWGHWLAEHGPTGSDHPNWRGGYGDYYGASWRKAKRAVRERDKVCQECGVSSDEYGRTLDVNHIVPFREFGRERHEEANALDNLELLCPPCHTKRDWSDEMIARGRLVGLGFDAQAWLD